MKFYRHRNTVCPALRANHVRRIKSRQQTLANLEKVESTLGRGNLDGRFT